MKTSVFLAIYNRPDLLPNVLTSLARQKTTFPFEICIIDDHSEVDPKPLIEKYLKDVDFKYKRLEKNVSTMFSQCKCWDLISPDSDTIVIISSDVILTSNNIIEELSNNVSKKKIALSDVRNCPISINFWEDFENNVNKFFEGDWKTMKPYQGPYTQGRWYFFLGAIKRKDLELVGHKNLACDVVIADNMRKEGFSAYYSHSVGIHQSHLNNIWPCSIIKKCKHKCYRK